MYLNFPVFATGVRIFKASNDVGSWVHMNTRKKHKVRNKMAGYCLISYYCRFPWFLKNKRMECTNLVDPHQLLCTWFAVVFVLFCIYTPLFYFHDNCGKVSYRFRFFFGLSRSTRCGCDLNFPVFATGVRIFRASNDVGPLFLGPGFTRILEINTR